MSVQTELDSARHLGAQLEELIVQKGQIDVDGRTVLLLGLWALIFDFHKGILSLLSNGFSGSAFALLRPVVEALIRSHVVVRGSDADVQKIRDDEYRVNFVEIGPWIDAQFGYGTLIQKLLQEARTILHSLTHSGAFQIARRFDGHDLTPRYPDGEILVVIRVTTSAVWIVTNLVTKHFNLEDEAKEVEKLVLEWGMVSANSGLPVMRPLFLEYPDDDSLRGDVFAGENTEFLFGRDLLVAPRLFEMVGAYQIRLPQGDWYDYWSGHKVSGGQIVWVDPALESMPLYARAGAIVPQQPVVQYTGETPRGPLELRVYPGADCQGSLYLDDGWSYAYTRGQFLRVEYSCKVAPDLLQVSISSREGAFAPWWIHVEVQLFGVEQKPQEVRAGDRALTGWTYDSATQSVMVTVPDSPFGLRVRLSY